jgi:hypothetical protein
MAMSGVLLSCRAMRGIDACASGPLCFSSACILWFNGCGDDDVDGVVVVLQTMSYLLSYAYHGMPVPAPVLWLVL